MTISLTGVQQALITKIKAMSGVTTLLQYPLDIREVEWQGTDFLYPNVRVRVQEFERKDPGSNCQLFSVIANVYVFGEDASSLLTNSIADVVFDQLDTKSLTISGIKFIAIRAKQFGAAWVEESGTWRSEIRLNFQVS